MVPFLLLPWRHLILLVITVALLLIVGLACLLMEIMHFCLCPVLIFSQPETVCLALPSQQPSALSESVFEAQLETVT
jgi:hypothetical protein